MAATLSSRTGRRFMSALAVLLGGALAIASPAAAQDSLDVVFRYLPDLTGTAHSHLHRAYLPGSFNNWGNNQSGRIPVGDPSQMDFHAESDEYRYEVRLRVGAIYQYKIHLHFDEDGQSWDWLSDPLNPIVNPADNNNSVLELRDPMAFQLARRQDASGDIWEVSATILSSDDIDSLGFEVNGVLQDGLPHYDEATGIFRYALDEPVPSGSQFAIGARTTSGARTSAEVGILPPSVVDASRPEGVEDGINQHGPSSGSITFSLFAPGKSHIHLIGDFNDWTPGDDYLMYRDAIRPDSVHWWITVDGLDPGTEYAFQYLVDGELRIADPFSEKVLDPNHDRFISSTTYPGLMSYPTGKTTEIVSVARPAADSDTHPTIAPRPGTLQHELVIYELLIRDFLQNATYQTLRDTIGYLKRLGVNAIELMPVSQFDGNLSWGYNPTFHAAVEKAYGPKSALQEFIAAAHQEGVAVIVDAVYNHAHPNSPLVRLYGGSPSNPFLKIPPSHPYSVFHQLNHDHPYIHYYIDRANRFWLEEMRVDGFRFDLTKGFMTSGNVDGYNPDRIRNLKRMADAIWAMDAAEEGVDPFRWQPYLILEHFAADDEERELASYRVDEGMPGMMLWNNVNHAFSEATMGYHSNNQSNFAHAYFGPGGRNWDLPHLISYMESHDEQWLMLKMRKFGNDGPNGYDVKSLPTALDRMKMAGTFFFTTPGPKMMWQFGELGYGWGPRECLKPGGSGSGDCLATDPGRTDQKPIPWEYFDDELRQKLYRTWSELLRLRREHYVFRDPETPVLQAVAGPVKRITLIHEETNVLIVGNFDVNAREVDVPFPHDGMWFNFFEGSSVEVGAGSLRMLLLPGEFHLFTSEWVEPAQPGLITVDSDVVPELPGVFSLEQNYPNPFNPATQIRFSLPQSGHARLEVFDVIGRSISVLVDEQLPAGRHSVHFDAATMASGLYLYRLSSGAHTQTRTMMVVK